MGNNNTIQEHANQLMDVIIAGARRQLLCQCRILRRQTDGPVCSFSDSPDYAAGDAVRKAPFRPGQAEFCEPFSTAAIFYFPQPWQWSSVVANSWTAVRLRIRRRRRTTMIALASGADSPCRARCLDDRFAGHITARMWLPSRQHHAAGCPSSSGLPGQVGCPGAGIAVAIAFTTQAVLLWWRLSRHCGRPTWAQSLLPPPCGAWQWCRCWISAPPLIASPAAGGGATFVIGWYFVALLRYSGIPSAAYDHHRR